MGTFRRTVIVLGMMLCLVPASWAGWRASGGLYWGWPGPWYPYDYYGPYYPYADYPYDAYDPYGYAPDYTDVAPPAREESVQPAGEQPAAADPSPQDSKSIQRAISHARGYLDFRLSDGDISRAQHDAGMRQLMQIKQQAGAASALTTDQDYAFLKQIQTIDPTLTLPAYRRVRSVTPSAAATPSGNRVEARRDLKNVDDLLLQLRTLLDEKLKGNDITRAQHDSEMSYLNDIDKQAHQDADANGGYLKASQEDQLQQFLYQSYYRINHNFISR